MPLVCCTVTPPVHGVSKLVSMHAVEWLSILLIDALLSVSWLADGGW